MTASDFEPGITAGYELSLARCPSIKIQLLVIDPLERGIVYIQAIQVLKELER